MDNKVEIAKSIDLEEGEELMDYVGKVHSAVEKLAEVPAPWDKKQKVAKYWLKGIFSGSVVVRERDTGKFYRMPLTKEKGTIKIGPGSEEVRTAFVAVSNMNKVTKAEGEDPADPRLVELPALTLVAKGNSLTEESIGLLNEIVKSQEDGSPETQYVDVKQEVAPTQEPESKRSLWDNVIPG